MRDLTPEVTELMRKRLTHAFKIGRGTLMGSLLSIEESKNLYGDVVSAVTVETLALGVVIEYSSPRKVIVTGKQQIGRAHV